MDKLLTVSPSPHIRHSRTTTSVMGTVLLALLPTAVASVILFGVRALLILIVSNLSCFLLELGWCKLRKQKNTTGDLSCLVTGTLLGLTLPASFGELENLWTIVIGALIAIIVVKECFGGIGYNFANPAITARIAMLVCFPSLMSATDHTVFTDPTISSSATPLGDLALGNTELLPSLTDMLIGNRAGAIGEGCAVTLILGGLILVLTGTISWHIPVSFIGTLAVFTFFTGGLSIETSAFHILAGGALIGAIFMATDYVTSPDTAKGKIIFGIGCGIITSAIRIWGAYPEGVSFAILLMNILNPYIIKLTRRKPFGGVKQ